MARDFNGSSDISYTLAAGQVSPTVYSIAWWEYFDSNAQYRRPWHWGGTNGTVDTRMELDDGWGFVFVAGRSTTPGAWSISKPSTGSWHHMCVTYDTTSTSNDPIIYLNGTAQSILERLTPSGTASTNLTPFYIGSERGTGQYMDGRLAELGFWHRILTASEVVSLSKGFSPAFFPASLKFFTPLIGKDTDEADLIYGTSGSVDAGVTAIAHPRIIYPSNYNIAPFSTAAAPSVIPNKQYQFNQSIKRSNYY